MTTISDGTTILTPILIDGYSSSREAGNIVHQLVGTAWPAVTLRPAKPRTGTLSMLCADLADALALESLHAAATTLTLVDADLAALGMAYVTVSEIVVELDDDTRTLWWVRVGFQEIQP